MIESACGYAYLQSTLNVAAITSAGALGVWPDVVPQGESTPALVYGLQSSVDTNSASAYRLLSDTVFWVRAVGLAEQFPTLVAIADAADTLLQRVQGAAGSATILMCVREQSLILTQQIDGLLYSTVGQMYRILINTGQ